MSTRLQSILGTTSKVTIKGQFMGKKQLKIETCYADLAPLRKIFD